MENFNMIDLVQHTEHDHIYDKIQRFNNKNKESTQLSIYKLMVSCVNAILHLLPDRHPMAASHPSHLIYARKRRKKTKEEGINDKREHLFVSLVLRLFVLFRISISSEVDSHCPSIILLIESDNVDSEPGPAAVDVQAAVSVVHKPLILHLFRNKSLLDFYHLFL